MVSVRLHEVGHVPGLSYHLLTLRLIANAGNCYIDISKDITITFSESGDKLCSRSIGKLDGIYGYITDQPNDQAHAVNAPGAIPSPQVANISDFHRSNGYPYEALLSNTVRQTGVKLDGELSPCSGCLQAKGKCKPIKAYSTIRAVMPGGRVFVKLVGEKPVQSPGGN